MNLQSQFVPTPLLAVGDAFRKTFQKVLFLALFRISEWVPRAPPPPVFKKPLVRIQTNAWRASHPARWPAGNLNAASADRMALTHHEPIGVVVATGGLGVLAPVPAQSVKKGQKT